MADSEARLRIVIDALNQSQAETKALLDDLKGIEKQTEKTKFSLREFVTDSDKLKSVGDKMTLGVTLPLAGVATAATKLASDLNETRSKTSVIFGEMSDDIQAWAEGANKNLGQTRRQALDGAADFAIFGKSAGLAGKDLTAFAESNVELASDMASFFNTSPDEAIQAIGAAFRGEAEPIRKYGVLINDAALKDEALRQGLIKTTTEALTPQQRVLAAQALIFKQTSDAQGDFARTSDGLANSTRITKAQLEDALATLGEKFLPIAKRGVDMVSALVQAFSDLSPEVQNIIIVIGALAAGMGPVLSVGGRLITTLSTIKDVAAALGGGFVGLVKNAGDIAQYLRTAGLSADSLKVAFQYLKAGGGLLAAELGVIVAGLAIIITYLDRVGKAARATNEDLIAMSRSGDVFDQAAASTEILANGQERLKKALDGTHEKIKTGAKDYADYKSSIEATAAAAGYQINAHGDLVQVMYGLGGATEKVVEENYRLSESEYQIETTGRSRAEITRDLVNGLIDLSAKAQAYNATAANTTTQEDNLTATMRAQAQAMQLNAMELQRLSDQKAAAAAADAIYRAGLAETTTKIAGMAQALANASDAQAKQMLAQVQLDAIKKAYENGTISQEGFTRATDAVLLRYDLATPKSLAMAEAQQKITDAFLSGDLPLNTYITAADKIPGIAEDGKTTLKELAELGVKPTTGAIAAQKEEIAKLPGVWNKVPKDYTTTYHIVTEGKVPSGGSTTPASKPSGKDNTRALGGPVNEGWWYLHNDEFVLSKAMREGRAQIPAGAVPTSGVSGSRTTVNNVFLQDTLATKMFLEEQRLNELAEIEAVM